MSTKNQREQLMHTAIGQVAIIVVVLAGTWMYTIPLYTSLSASVTLTNEAIEKFTQTSQNGIPYKEIDVLLKKNKWQEELLWIIQSAPIETQNAIKKIGGDTYLNWLKQAIESNTSKDEKLNLVLKKARLNSILPTLNPISNNINEETVSMKKYITFVEENILKKFQLDSTASLSIQGIRYGKKWWIMPDVVGSFDNEISFKATNENIIKMINYVNLLGHPEILTDTGIINGWTPTIMSNPLAMIDSFSLENILDTTKPNEENSGRMTLRFYIRGSSINDVAFLGSTIASRKSILAKKIETTLTKCLAEVTCPKKKDLQGLSRKYTEFNRSSISKKVTQWTELVYSLSSELDSIKALEDEYNKLTGK
jgi:hypothetical protein